MSFDDYARKGKVEGRGGANNINRIKSPQLIELPKINQGPKEPVNNRNNLKRIPQTKESLKKTKFVAPKIQIYEPKPPFPSQKVIKPANNMPLAKAQLAFSKKNPKNLPPLEGKSKIYGSKASNIKSKSEELMETQNEIANVKAQLKFLTDNPDYIPQTNENEDNEKLIETERQIARVEAELEFLANNPDYVPEIAECEEQPKKNTPKVQSQSQEIIDTENQIAKVQAELEFLENHPDTNENEKPKKNEPQGPNKVASKALKKIERNNTQNANKSETQKNNDIDIIFYTNNNTEKLNTIEIMSTKMSKIPPISGQVTKAPPAKLSKIPKAIPKSEIAPPEVDHEYELLAGSPDAQKDLLALRATEKKISEMKVQLALMKKDPSLIEQENLAKQNKPPKQPDNKAVVQSKNKVADVKAELELLQHNQDEPFEEYARRMKKRSHKKEPPNKLDTILEEESEIVDESYGEEDFTENVTEAEDINEEEVNQAEWEEGYDEEPKTSYEEEFEAADEECERTDEEVDQAEWEEGYEEQPKAGYEEEFESADEECEEIDGEEDEEIEEMIEEELKGDETTDVDKFGEEIEKNNKPQKSDASLNPEKKRNLMNILKKMNWINLADGDNPESEEPNESEEEENSIECVEVNETLLAENTDDKAGVGTLQSDSLTKLDVKCEQDLFTSFFKSKALKEEEMESASDKSTLKLHKFREELVESTPRAQEVHTKSNVFEKSLLKCADETSDGESFSSFFDERPVVKSKNQNIPAETESDQSISECETNESKQPVDDKDTETIEPAIKYNLAQDKRDRRTLQELKRQPSSIKCNLERDKEKDLIRRPSTIRFNLEKVDSDETTSEDMKEQLSAIKCNLQKDKGDGISSKDLKLQTSTKEEPKKPVDDKDKKPIKTTLNDLQREPPIKYNLAQDKRDRLVLPELKRRPSTIRFNLEKDDSDETTSADMKGQPSAIECNLELDKEKDLKRRPSTIRFNLEKEDSDETTSEYIKEQPSAIECNLENDDSDETTSNGLNRLHASKCNLELDKMDDTSSDDLKEQPSAINSNLEQNIETDKEDEKLVYSPKHKIINVLPCQSNEVEYRDGIKPDHSDQPTKTNEPKCNVQYTNVRDFTSNSGTEKEDSLRIESVHISDESIEEDKYNDRCHLYKVKIRIKSINWRGAGEMKAVTLSFYNPFTKEMAPVKRKFILPYFYTKDFYCYVSYVSPPKMLDSSLAYYPPIIFITKRKSDTELARGVVNMNKEQLQHKSNSFYTNMTLTYKGMIMGNAVLSVKVLDYGFLRKDVDDGTNEIIQIIFNEIKSKEMKIAGHEDFVDNKPRKRENKLILEENSSSGDDTSSALPQDQLFKKRPFRYKRENKSDGSERSRRPTNKRSHIVTSSTSVQTDQIKKPKSFINNCKDIQTDVQEEDLDKPTPQTKMIQTETEVDSKCPAKNKGESKITQTEAINEQKIVNVYKNKLYKNYEIVETYEEPISDFVTAETEEEHLTSYSVSVKIPENVKKAKSKPQKLKQVPVRKILSESEELLESEEEFLESEVTVSIDLKRNRLSRPKTAKVLTIKAVQEQIDVRISRKKTKSYETETIIDSVEEYSIIEQSTADVREYLDGKQLAEQFFQVCVEQRPLPFDKMSYANLQKYKRKYVKKLRDALPSEFGTPSSMRNNEIYSSERRWMSHMAAFLYDNKATTSDACSTTVDKTDDQISEMQSEVAPPDVLMNNPDFHAMKKFYHPEYCQVDVMTSTAEPYFEPLTHDCGAQTSERIVNQFTAQTREKTLQLLSKTSKNILKNAKLQTCLVVVDTIPPAQNGSEKLVNKNILYERVCEPQKLQDKKSIKAITLTKSYTQLESYPEQCSTSIQEKDLVINLQSELCDFLINIRSEVHFLKHRAQFIQVPKHKTKSKSTDFDRLMKSFTSLVAHNEERDFNVVYGELQQLQNLVFDTFKKYSEHVESKSKAKQMKNVNNYEAQDKELKFIFKNPTVNKKAPKRKNRDKSFKTRSLPDIESSSTLLDETDNSYSKTAAPPFYTRFRNRFFPFKKKQVISDKDSESSLTPLGQRLSEKSVLISPGLNIQNIEVEKAQMEAIKEKMNNVQLKLRYYLEEREVITNKNNKNNSGLEQMSQNIFKLLHELRRLKSYVQKVYKL